MLKRAQIGFILEFLLRTHSIKLWVGVQLHFNTKSIPEGTILEWKGTCIVILLAMFEKNLWQVVLLVNR